MHCRSQRNTRVRHYVSHEQKGISAELKQYMNGFHTVVVKIAMLFFQFQNNLDLSAAFVSSQQAKTTLPKSLLWPSTSCTAPRTSSSHICRASDSRSVSASTRDQRWPASSAPRHHVTASSAIPLYSPPKQKRRGYVSYVGVFYSLLLLFKEFFNISNDLIQSTFSLLFIYNFCASQHHLILFSPSLYLQSVCLFQY